MPEETSQSNSPIAAWFSDVNLKTVLIVALLSSVLGIGGGAGASAFKSVQAAGMSQNEGDLRYQTKDEARNQEARNDTQLEQLKTELKADIEKTLKKESFDIWQRTWEERQKNFDQKLDRALEK